MRLWPWVVAAVLLVAARPAHAQDGGSTYRAVIDRIDLEPASVGGFRLRVFVSALSLDGRLLDLTEPKSIKVRAGKSEIRAPYALGQFAGTQTDLAMVLVIQATSEYADVLGVITEAADAGLLAALPERVQIAVVTYGDAVGSGKLGTLKAARSRLKQLSSEGASSEPALLDALDRALRLLKGAKTEPEGRPLRKMVVVVGDGRDKANDRERVTALGRRAGTAGVRIHTFGHAPNDVRRPLLLLGELSKRSFGTFRWLRKDATTAAQWQSRFQQLAAEINQQYVVTYFVDDDGLAGRELELTTTGRTVLTSLNKLRVPAAGCNGEPCEGGYCADGCVKVREGGERGVLGWIFLVVVIGIGGLLLLSGVGYVINRRQQASASAPAIPHPPGAAPPGSVPPGAHVPSRPPATAGFPSAPPQPVAAPASGARLYIMTGPRAGETLGLRHGFLIGAAPSSDLVIADGFASSRHAQIGVDAQGNCWLSDLGSTNGTFINGVRITQKVLDHGVTVRIGSTEIRFLAQ